MHPIEHDLNGGGAGPPKRLAVGRECPYFETGHEFANLRWTRYGNVPDKVTAIQGPSDEEYLRCRDDACDSSSPAAPVYFLAAGGESCSAACAVRSAECELTAIQYAATSVQICNGIIESLGKRPKTGGQYQDDNSRCMYHPGQTGWYQVMKKDGPTTCAEVNTDSSRRRVCMCDEGKGGPDKDASVSSTDTTPLVAINMVVDLPYTLSTFTSDAQRAFKRALADTARVKKGMVVINSINPTALSRRQQHAQKQVGITVDVTINDVSKAASAGMHFTRTQMR